jgi:hypothetical protein
MSFELDEQYKMIGDIATQFAKAEIAPRAKAIDKNAEFPLDIIKKMADYMLIAVQRGINVTPEDVLPIVRDEIQNDIKQMFSLMPEDVIEQLVGKDNFKLGYYVFATQSGSSHILKPKSSSIEKCC